MADNPIENALGKFDQQDLNKPGVTGLAKKHERLILFIAAMTGVVLFILYFQKQSGAASTSTAGTGGGGGGISTTGTPTGTTTGDNATPISFSIAQTSDNGVQYSGTHNTASSHSGSLGFSIGGFGIGGSEGSSSQDQRNRTVNAAQSFGTQASITGGTQSAVSDLLDAIQVSEGTYEQRLQGQEALLAEAKQGAPA